MHMDMDSFFCSVERALDPRLVGKPVVVGGPLSGRGVISSSSYEARAKGVRSGMPIARALSLCPDAILLPARPKTYTQVSAGILRILSSHTDLVEPTSIDEAFLDFSTLPGGFPGVVRRAEKIRVSIQKRYRLTASVGIAPTKAIAKIASRRAKPDGIEVVSAERARAYLADLPVSELSGIGEKTARSLHLLGIRTLGDLAGIDPRILSRSLGKNGGTLVRLARGEEISQVVPYADLPDAKSMSHERTFPVDISDEEALETSLLLLSEKLARRLRRERLAGDTFRIKLRFPDFSTILRSRVLHSLTNDEKTLFALARDGLRRYRGGRPIRLIGIGLARLVPVPAEAIDLGLDRSRNRYRNVLPVMDAVRDRFGEKMMTKARLL